MEVTDEHIVIDGGKHAADELAAFLQNGKRVKYFPARMNHKVAREWCAKSGVSVPGFNVAAHNVWFINSRFVQE